MSGHTKGITFKPIFHWTLRSRWLPSANEIDTKNMKCTWPTRAPTLGDPLQPIFHLLALGVCVGGNANFGVCVRGNANFRVLRYQHVGIFNAKLGVGGIAQREPPTQGICAAVEYRLDFNSASHMNYKMRIVLFTDNQRNGHF